ncbi:hypothetical protein LB505_013870 [Fusarium chuoi]|nr:hypothetical protein LB505_013870 [Fusarium chuoi]
MASPPVPILPAVNTYEPQPRRSMPLSLPPPPPPHHHSPVTSTPGSGTRPDSHSGQRNVGASVCSNSPSAVDSMTAVIDEGTILWEEQRGFFHCSDQKSHRRQAREVCSLK